MWYFSICKRGFTQTFVQTYYLRINKVNDYRLDDWGWCHSLPSGAEVKNGEAIDPFLHSSSWHSA
jgi:hypothetical protein